MRALVFASCCMTGFSDEDGEVEREMMELEVLSVKTDEVKSDLKGMTRG